AAPPGQRKEAPVIRTTCSPPATRSARSAARPAGFAAMGLLLLLTTGCQSLRYHSNDELWASGDAAFDRGDYDDAIPYYDELLRRNDGETRALLMRGVAHERTAETHAALE